MYVPVCFYVQQDYTRYHTLRIDCNVPVGNIGCTTTESTSNNVSLVTKKPWTSRLVEKIIIVVTIVMILGQPLPAVTVQLSSQLLQRVLVIEYTAKGKGKGALRDEPRDGLAKLLGEDVTAYAFVNNLLQRVAKSLVALPERWVASTNPLAKLLLAGSRVLCDIIEQLE